MTDQQAGGESRARCDAPHAKAKGPHFPRANWTGQIAPLEPGTKVTMRVKPLTGSPLAPRFVPNGGEYVILGVITERQKHGFTTRYRIGGGGGVGATFEVAPELVEPVPESTVTVTALSPDEVRDLFAAIGKGVGAMEAMPAASVRERCPASGDYELVAFNEVAPSLMESECGRFRVTHTPDVWSAFDTWTGETSPPSPGREPALKWVARRAVAPVPPLNWIDFPGGARVERMGTAFEVFAVAGGKFKAFDPRFRSEAFSSPLFGTLNEAKAWCAVRAMCESQPMPSGSGSRPVLVV